MMKDTIGGLSLVKLDISGYNLTYKSLFFSTDKCLQSKQKILDIYTSPIRRGKNRLLSLTFIFTPSKEMFKSLSSSFITIHKSISFS